jgi:membrane-associated phospholipid phosphatase
VIQEEIDQLFIMMEDDRDRYLAEINAQADGLAAYVISFIDADGERRPFTLELIRCGLAIGNIVYMYYKESFRRVRASVICPGLVPPFGPPRHPSFPSGHSFLGHFIGLLLLEIPEIAATFGEITPALPPTSPPVISPAPGTTPFTREKADINNVMSTAAYPFNGPLMWLADRLAKNRERAGLHYPSDSAASQWLAGAIWTVLTKTVPIALPHSKPGSPHRNSDPIDCPTLQRILRLAQAEWKP